MWIESHQELARHPKMKRFARLLGISHPTAIGYLHLLWWWAVDYAPSGILDGYSPEDLAEGALFDGSPADFLSALLDARFIDRSANDDLSLHDWDEWSRKSGRRIVHPGRRAWEATGRALRRRILERDGYRCRLCGSPIRPEVDHIIPIARGGSNEEANLQTLCRLHNRVKGPR